MTLVIISEFAKNKPGDDLKIIFHNSPILGQDALLEIVVPTYMGIFSSGGQDPVEKYGNIPLKKERIAIAWSVNSEECVRMIIAVVPNLEVNRILKKIANDEVQNRIIQIKQILTPAEYDSKTLERNIIQLDSEISIFDEASRISKVFSDEI